MKSDAKHLPAQIYDLSPRPKRRRIRFNCAKDAVRLLTVVVNDVVSDVMPLAKAKVLIQAASALSTVYAQTEVDGKIKDIEDFLKENY